MKFFPLFLPLLASARIIQLHSSGNENTSPYISQHQSFVHTSGYWSYEDCGLSEDIIQIRSIETSPMQPIPGKPLTLTVKAEILKEIHGGAYTAITVKIGLLKILTRKVDLCNEKLDPGAKDTFLDCPVPVGTKEFTWAYNLPKYIPGVSATADVRFKPTDSQLTLKKAKFVVDIEGHTVDNANLMCLKIMVDFLRWM